VARLRQEAVAVVRQFLAPLRAPPPDRRPTMKPGQTDLDHRKPLERRKLGGQAQALLTKSHK
jgi:hypothetical protein